jgi:hypothetical protein
MTSTHIAQTIQSQLQVYTEAANRYSRYATCVFLPTVLLPIATTFLTAFAASSLVTDQHTQQALNVAGATLGGVLTAITTLNGYLNYSAYVTAFSTVSDALYNLTVTYDLDNLSATDLPAVQTKYMCVIDSCPYYPLPNPHAGGVIAHQLGVQAPRGRLVVSRTPTPAPGSPPPTSPPGSAPISAPTAITLPPPVATTRLIV